jgi:hypothetical protein
MNDTSGPRADANERLRRDRRRPTLEDFLEQLRPAGCWVLTAIVPDGPTKTITADSRRDARRFVEEHDGTRNLYFSVNPTRTAMSSKAAKVDIAAIEYVLADLDPREDESPEAAKARYRENLRNNPTPTVIIDSGNGLQALWRLSKRIVLPEPITNERGQRSHAPEAIKIIADVEDRTKALIERLGSVAGTQNIDRILRLPGTTNLPNAKKRKAGRVPSPTRLIEFNDTAYDLDAFPRPAAKDDKAKRQSGTRQQRAAPPVAHDELDDLIRNGCGDRYDGDRSHAVWFVVNEMLRRGYLPTTIERVLLDHRNGISDHIYDQKPPAEYAARQVTKAVAEIDFSFDQEGRPYPSQNNIRIALLKMGVQLRYDQFAAHTLIEGLAGFGPVLDDGAVDRIWLQIEQLFHFRPARGLFLTVMNDTAKLNSFHPVCDYLDSLRWDGVPRIDQWLTTYGGAADDDYTRAVGAIVLIAAVRRVRQPGCKFDEMLVLECPEQGTDKSSALAILAVKTEWFSDDLPLNIQGKALIEALRGRWIIEAAELSGMRRADIEHLKGVLSRQVDRARMSYDRLVSEVPRQSIPIGTTNSLEYLRDTSGNRRFWPVLVKSFNLKALREDRDQLWAEAAAREAEGTSIRLDPKLWSLAERQQEWRLTQDPWHQLLSDQLGEYKHAKISTEAIWTILDSKPAQRGKEQSRRVGEAMRKLGWDRPNAAGTVRIGGKLVSGYVIGRKPWRTVQVIRDQDGLCVTLGEDRDDGPLFKNRERES